VAATRIRCQVLESPAQDGWSSRRERPRDLLPWADPYIAGLVRRLEERYDAEADCSTSDPFDADHASGDTAAFDDGWQEDAFMPRPLEAPRFHCYPPVYGGFPLLDRIGDEATGK